MPASDFVTTDPTELAERIDTAHDRFAALVAAAPEDLPVSASWNVREVACHLVNVINRYNAFSPDRLADAPRGVDLINERELTALDGRPLPEVLELLDEEMAAFQRTWGPGSGLPLDLPLPFHGGGSIDLQSGLANVIGELLVHGLDVARATATPWPIDDRDGALLVGLATQILPAYVRADNTARLTVRFDAEGVAPWLLAVDGTTASSRPPSDGDPDPDVAFRGPAATVALLFYGRIDLADAEAAGLVVCGGAHPDRAGELSTTFEAP